MTTISAPMALGLLLSLSSAAFLARGDDDASWTKEFPVETGELVSVGRNPYFILEPGYHLVLEGKKVHLEITVLDETKTLAGVETRIVEERESKNGQLVEVSRNYFAISKRSNSVFYFGEDVDMYKDGKVESHDGSWHAGENGAKFGLMIPGQPLLHGRFYQEVAPEVAMDRSEIVSLSELLKTPAGEFHNCLKSEETTPLEPDSKEYKVYAVGVGLVEDGELRLVEHGKVPK